MSPASKLAALLAILSAAASTGCGDRSEADSPLVFVAASFDRAISAVDTAVSLRVQSASSSVLARQIANGAKPSCFVSANLEWMDFVEDGDLIEVDLDKFELNIKIRDDELVARLDNWQAKPAPYTKGVLSKYIKLVQPASTGAITG